VRSAGKSDCGLVRENNEDALLVDGENGIFLLADGMGGGPGGEVASWLAVHAAHDHLLVKLYEQSGAADISHLLADALARAHSAVARRALDDPSLTGMGTTLEIMAIRGDVANWCHVGDSRIYLFRGGTLDQLTVDDNYAGYLAKSRNIPPDRIPSAYRHILTQAIGLDRELVPEIGAMDIEPGDLFLICSDGLNAALEDAEIEEILGRGEPAEMADALVAAANDRGGPDNVSVIIIEP
jgi:serine/threonine protein phosphatase PrpC